MQKKFDAVAIEVEMHKVTLEELISRGMELREKKDNIAWELGDLAIIVTAEFGSKELSVFSKGIGIEVGTIRRYRDVSKAYTPEQRAMFRMLSWSHFRQLAAREDRIELLTRAHDEGWSWEKLCVMTQLNTENIIDDGKAVPPLPEMLFCSGCRLWFPASKESICQTRGKCMDLHK